MIEIQKHLTIKEAKNEKTKLENELELYLNKKEINYIKTQPQATSIKDIMTTGGTHISDKFAHYMIRDEELDTKIYELQESINAYERYIINEMKRISESGGSEMIVYLRDEERKSWNDIVKMVHYSRKQCYNLYKKAKNQ